MLILTDAEAMLVLLLVSIASMAATSFLYLRLARVMKDHRAGDDRLKKIRATSLLLIFALAVTALAALANPWVFLLADQDEAKSSVRPTTEPVRVEEAKTEKEPFHLSSLSASRLIFNVCLFLLSASLLYRREISRRGQHLGEGQMQLIT